MTGSGNMYGGAYFLDEGVILITLNYRLGALGEIKKIKNPNSSTF